MNTFRLELHGDMPLKKSQGIHVGLFVMVTRACATLTSIGKYPNCVLVVAMLRFFCKLLVTPLCLGGQCFLKIGKKNIYNF